MTDPQPRAAAAPPATGSKAAGKRHAAERRFRFYGAASIAIALGVLCLLLVSMVAQGFGAFFQTHIRLEIHFDAALIDPDGSRAAETIGEANYRELLRRTLYAAFPDVRAGRDLRRLGKLISPGAALDVRAMVLQTPSMIGSRRTLWVVASDDVDQLVKGNIARNVPESARRLNDRQIEWLDALARAGALERRFNWRFFTAGDSREPELAGIRGAMVGSFLTMIVALMLSFPFGVATALYLEEFAPKNRLTDVIEVNINNLAAVPSIVFGLLGLAVFLNFFAMPRSAPVVGGLVLSLMTLPTVIISARAALLAVPPSIREAALAVGASPMQVVLHHVLPLAVPGILTGTIIGAARALGETAPLLMIGMVAFIVDIPRSIADPATVLPVQIFLWADSPERAFVEKTAAATVVLLFFLILMNLIAVLLRKKFERRW